MTEQFITQNKPQVNRYAFIDFLRGFFILLMVVYHFCYDLDLFGYIDTAFGKNYWIPFRYVIVIGFLSLVGVSLVLVHSNKIKWQSMKKRSWQLLLAAIAVSISSYFIAPSQVTLFGILQFILLASWLALPFVNRYKLALLLGIVVFTLGHSFTSAIFDSIWLHWLGMNENERKALDFVPLFPWFGTVLIGISLGHWLFYSVKGQAVARLQLGNIRGLATISSVLEKAGQHSLLIYLVHQPILFAAFYAVEMIK